NIGLNVVTERFAYVNGATGLVANANAPVGLDSLVSTTVIPIPALGYVVGLRSWLTQVPSAGTWNVQVSQGPMGGGIASIVSAGGLIKITTTNPNGLYTGQQVVIAGVTGTTEANGTWIVTPIIDADGYRDEKVFTLNG